MTKCPKIKVLVLTFYAKWLNMGTSPYPVKYLKAMSQDKLMYGDSEDLNILPQTDKKVVLSKLVSLKTAVICYEALLSNLLC